MRTLTAILVISAFGVHVLAGLSPGDADAGAPAADMLEPGPRAEAPRIQAHLSEVEEALRLEDAAHLDEATRMRRAEKLAWLRDYRIAGIFPHNHTHRDERVPVFVDAHGTPCAVGYLLRRSGDEELVQAVVSTDNNVRVADLSGDARFRGWLDHHGLTLDEAARIQPAYGGCGMMGCPPEPDPEPMEHYNPASLALAGLTTGAAAWGLMSDRTLRGSDWAGWAGLGLGLAEGAYAVRGARASKDPWAVAMNAAAGLAGTAIGLNRLLRRDNHAALAERRESLTLVPWVSGEQRGVVVTLRR